jgi:Inner membrane protein YgaP-like, transmembrane domain
MKFLDWMSTPPGRVLRVLFGLVLVGVGLGIVHGVAGTAVAAFGLVPLTTAIINVCPVRPLVDLWQRRRPVASREGKPPAVAG